MTRSFTGRVASAIASCTTALALVTPSGCASLQTPTPYVADPHLDFPVFGRADEVTMAASSDDGLAEPATAALRITATGFGAPARPEDDATSNDDAITTSAGEVLQADGVEPRDAELDPRWRKSSPALFWTGIAVGSLGSAFLLGGGITGSVTQRQVRNAYDDGATKADLDRLVARGEVSNDFVIAGSVLALAGYALAVVVAGIDEKRCGSVLRKARRRECERR